MMRDFRGGVRVGASEFSLDNHADIVTSAGPGGGPHVRVFDTQNPNFNVENNFVFGTFTGGVFVSGSENYKFLQEAQALADGGTLVSDAGDSPTLAEAETIPAATVSRLTEAGLSAGQTRHLPDVPSALSDPLGFALEGTVLLDRIAADAGWSIAPAPILDDQFAPTAAGDWVAVSANARGVDWLSVILHELSHQLGGRNWNAAFHPADMLADHIAPARRPIPSAQSLDAVFSSDDLIGDLLQSRAD